jgi:hypothetical protein
LNQNNPIFHVSDPNLFQISTLKESVEKVMVVHLSPDSKRHYQQLLKELAIYAELETDLTIVAADGRRSSCSSLVLAAASPFLVEWLLDGGDCVILPDMDGDWVDVSCHSLLQSPQASEDIRGLLEITRILDVDLGISWEIESEGVEEGEEEPMAEYVARSETSTDQATLPSHQHRRVQGQTLAGNQAWRHSDVPHHHTQGPRALKRGDQGGSQEGHQDGYH